MSLEFIIKNERESTLLDFKKEPYRTEKYGDLIKDIMAMSNAPIEGKRYIIIGIKDFPNGDREFHSIDKQKLVDVATYQQLLRDNVEPSINFSYYPFEIENNLVGVIEITNCDDPPYMMKKDFKGGLKKGDCLIRKGTQQGPLTRRDLDELLKFKSKHRFNNKINIGFNKKFEKELTVRAERHISPPSFKARIEIRKALDALKADSQLGNYHSLNRIMGQLSHTSSLEPLPYRYKNENELLKDLENLESDFQQHDQHYFSEEISEKINIFIENEGDSYLEDVSFQLFIPSEGIDVMDQVHFKPDVSSLYYDFDEWSQYPNVEQKNMCFMITEALDKVKHGQITNVFKADLRVVFFPEAANKVHKCRYKIQAKNLPVPIEGELTFKVNL